MRRTTWWSASKFGEVRFRIEPTSDGSYVPQIATDSSLLGRPSWKTIGTPQASPMDAEEAAFRYARSLDGVRNG